MLGLHMISSVDGLFIANIIPMLGRLPENKSRSSRSELEFDLSNFV